MGGPLAAFEGGGGGRDSPPAVDDGEYVGCASTMPILCSRAAKAALGGWSVGARGDDVAASGAEVVAAMGNVFG